MKNNKYNTVFLVSLYFLFVFICISMLLLGAQVFEGISETIDGNYGIRTSLSYVSVKVRQSNRKDNIFIDELNGAKMLVLVDDDGLSVYETRIYHYDGALHEMYISQGVPFQLSDGVRLVDIETLDFDLTDGVMKITARTANGTSQSLSIALRA